MTVALLVLIFIVWSVFTFLFLREDFADGRTPSQIIGGDIAEYGIVTFIGIFLTLAAVLFPYVLGIILLATIAVVGTFVGLGYLAKWSIKLENTIKQLKDE
jgi:hypothetical protein